VKEIPADRDISSARVLRAFTCQGERFEPNKHLMADEVLAIPIANRRALVRDGFLEIYAHQRQAPPWNAKDEHERAALRAWFVEQLDARDVEQIERNQARFLKLFAALPARCEPDRREPDKVVDQHGLVRKMSAAADKAQWRAGNPAPLRRHYPELEDVIPDEPPPGRGRHRAETRQKEADLLRRRAQAVADYNFLHGLWDHRGQWKGKEGARLLALEVVAHRHDLTVNEVEEALRRGGHHHPEIASNA
jgi:hypothetical protein